MIIQTVVGWKDKRTISSKDFGSLSIQPQYILRGSQTTQASNTVDTGTEVKPPVCTTEEWEKFCEEEGLEDGNGNSYYATDVYTTSTTTATTASTTL